ncbi:MAG: AmmeMemoRadiSam system protein A [Clostridiales bacterium]|nr:AmmeMemoRadiSam system protein A [Clostridiales bacterium]
MSELLDKDEQQFLLSLARRTIEHYLKTGEPPTVEAVENKKLQEKRGAFVTLKAGGELRGCIGYPLPIKPLYETIIDMAIAASTQDYRFAPLTPDELPRTRIEISVLSLPQPVTNISDIEVGKHGIIVSKGFHKGLLLPQVPVEYGWDRETFLRHGCLKAGLDEDEWKRGVQIEIFSAQVFSE